MEKQLLHSQGIILQAFARNERDLVLHTFTQNSGLVKIFIKNGRSGKQANNYSPFYELNWVLSRQRGEFYFPKESQLTTQNLHLRKNFALLKAASAMTKAVELTHPFWKPAPNIYQLLGRYLAHLTSQQFSAHMILSFYLKLLLHEGLLLLDSQCIHCHEKTNNLFLISEGSICDKCLLSLFKDKPPESLNPEERKLCILLAAVKSFSFFSELSALEDESFRKIEHFLRILIEN